MKKQLLIICALLLSGCAASFEKPSINTFNANSELPVHIKEVQGFDASFINIKSSVIYQSGTTQFLPFFKYQMRQGIVSFMKGPFPALVKEKISALAGYDPSLAKSDVTLVFKLNKVVYNTDPLLKGLNMFMTATLLDVKQEVKYTYDVKLRTDLNCDGFKCSIDEKSLDEFANDLVLDLKEKGLLPVKK